MKKQPDLYSADGRMPFLFINAQSRLRTKPIAKNWKILPNLTRWHKSVSPRITVKSSSKTTVRPDLQTAVHARPPAFSSRTPRMPPCRPTRTRNMHVDKNKIKISKRNTLLNACSGCMDEKQYYLRAKQGKNDCPDRFYDKKGPF